VTASGGRPNGPWSCGHLGGERIQVVPPDGEESFVEGERFVRKIAERKQKGWEKGEGIAGEGGGCGATVRKAIQGWVKTSRRGEAAVLLLGGMFFEVCAKGSSGEGGK